MNYFFTFDEPIGKLISLSEEINDKKFFARKGVADTTSLRVSYFYELLS